MTNSLALVSNYLIGVALVTQLILLGMQWNTYRKTGHSSLRLLFIATLFGLLYLAAYFAARKFWAAGHNPLAIYLLAAALITLQSVIGLFGTRSLFRAFERASSAT